MPPQQPKWLRQEGLHATGKQCWKEASNNFLRLLDDLHVVRWGLLKSAVQPAVWQREITSLPSKLLLEVYMYRGKQGCRDWCICLSAVQQGSAGPWLLSCLKPKTAAPSPKQPEPCYQVLLMDIFQ